jgi:hypothetical protein
MTILLRVWYASIQLPWRGNEHGQFDYCLHF